MSVAGTTVNQKSGEDIEYNKYTLITTLSGPFILEALETRLIIHEDKYKTGYECKECSGDGYLVNHECPMCVGRDKIKGYEDIKPDTNEGVPCRLCNTGRGMWDINSGHGFRTCDACEGKGAWIVVPQQSERRPTSGVIHSVGPGVVNPKLRPGVRVLYTIFAGTAIDFKGRGVCRIMHENEIMGIIYGQANLGDIVK